MAGLFCPFSYLQPLQLNMEHEAEEKRQPKKLSKIIRPFSHKKQIDSSPSCGGGKFVSNFHLSPGFSRWVLRFELGFFPPPRITAANEGFGWGFRTYKNVDVILVAEPASGCGFGRCKF